MVAVAAVVWGGYHFGLLWGRAVVGAVVAVVVGVTVAVVVVAAEPAAAGAAVVCRPVAEVRVVA